MEGIKFDQDKLRWGLVPWKEMEDVVRVLMKGASKYSDDNWMKVDLKRYKDAILRHELLYQGGEIIDKDSGLPHMAHVVCNALFIMWHEKAKVKVETDSIPQLNKSLVDSLFSPGYLARMIEETRPL